jgi:hypothetical protein
VVEFEILANIIDYMEKNGVTAKLVRLDVDQKLVNAIYSKSGTQYSILELQKAVDKCIAHEWLTHRSIGEKYKYLGITPKGVGAARSKEKSEEMKRSRTKIKRASDYIEDHKGLFLFLGFLIALLTLASKFFGVTQ